MERSFSRSRCNVFASTRGFMLAPLLYILALGGIGAAVMFSGYSQVLRSNAEMTSINAVRTQLQSASQTLSSASTIDSSQATPVLVPPSASAFNTVAASDAPKLPSGYSTVNNGTTPATNYGIIASTSGLRQLDPWGKYFIYCNWQNTTASADASKPAIQVISAGPSGVLQTHCGDTTASGDNRIINLATAEAINRANVWQVTSSSQVQFGINSNAVRVNNDGSMTAGAITASSLTITGGGTISTTGTLSVGLLQVTDAAGSRASLGVPSNSGDTATGTWGISISGNAATATKLAASKNFSIAGSTGLTASTVAFDGSADVALALAGTLAVANGGTGATAAGATASHNIGALAISSNLSDVANASTALTNLGGLAIANNLSELTATAATARSNLGLGSMAIQNADAVAITGGSISGTTISGNVSGNVSGSAGSVAAGNVTGCCVAISAGGTGQGNASSALTALGGLAIANNLSELVATAATARGHLGVPSNSGDTATGTWPISISGAAGSTSSLSATSGSVTISTGGSTRLTVDSNGDVGIGTAASAAARLDVNGDIRIQGAATTTRNLFYGTGSSNRWSLNTSATAEASGNVGSDFVISRYDNSGAFIDNVLSISRANKQVSLGGDLATNGSISAGTFYGTFVGNASGVTAAGSPGYVQYNSGGGLGASANFFWDAANNRLGLSTAIPSNALSFGGELARTIAIERAGIGAGTATIGAALTLQAGGAKAATADLNGGNLILSSGIATGLGSSAIQFVTYGAAASSSTADNTPVTAMTILGNGNVGIGTATPATLLEVEAITTTTAAATSYAGIIGMYSAPLGSSAVNLRGLYSIAQSSGAVSFTGDLTGGYNYALHNGTNTLAKAYGSYNNANNNTTGTITTGYGGYNIAQNSSTGTYSNAYGSFSDAYNGAGATMTNAYGAYGRVYHNATTTMSSAAGVYGLVQNNTTGTITNAYSVTAALTNASTGTVSNWYGLYVPAITNTTGTVSNRYPLYVADTGTAYIAGAVGIGTATPNAAALLDLTSTTQGLLPPRLTNAQRNAIASPALGLTIYNTDAAELETYDGATNGWEAVGAFANDAGGANGQVQFNNNSSLAGSANLFWDNTNFRLGIGSGTPASTLDVLSTATSTNGAAFADNSLTTGSAVSISSTATAGGASGASYLLNLSRSGANANASHTAYGIYSNVTNTGTTNTNVAGYFSASGATNNYGLIVANGNVGIGTSAPTSILDIAGVGSGGTASTVLTIGPTSGSGAGGIIFRGSNAGAITTTQISANYTGGLEFYSPDGVTISKTGYLNPHGGATFQVQGNATIGASYVQTVAPTNGVIIQGNVGIGTSSPAYTLDVQSSSTATAAGTTYAAQNLMTAAPAADSAASFRAAYNAVQLTGVYNYTADMTGAYNYVNFSAAAKTLALSYGAYNNANNSGTGTITAAYGAYNIAQNSSTGAITAAYGVFADAYNATGATMTNGYGAYGRVYHNATTTMSSAAGVYGLVQNNTTGTITNAYSVTAALTNNGTVTNWYGLYVPALTGTAPSTSRYPLYIADTGTAYIAGNVAVGANSGTNGKITLNGSTSGSVSLQAAAAAGSTTFTLPAADGTSGQVLSTNGSGTLSWASPTNASGATGAVQFSNGTSLTSDATNFFWDNTNKRLGIGSGTPAATLDVLSTATTTNGAAFADNALTTGSAVSISSTATAGGASGASYLLNLSRSGANANASHTAYGVYSNVTNTGTTGTNVAGYFSASGATNNYGLIVANGNVGIGITTPSTPLDLATNASGYGLRIRQDSTNGQSSNIQFTDYTVTKQVGRISADNSGNMTISSGFSGAATMYLNSSGNVGIGTSSPAYKLDVQSSSTATSAGITYTAQHLMTAAPGAASAQSFRGALNTAVSSTAYAYTGDLTGAYNYANHNTTTALTLGYGAYNNANNSGTGTITTGYGAYNIAQNSSTGAITAAYGVFADAYNATGGTMTNAYGAYGRVYHNATTTMASAAGVYGLVQNNTTGTITNAYSVTAALTNNGTVANWYGLYVPALTGTAPSSNRYPLYIADTGTAYIAGAVGIGTATPNANVKLDVAGPIKVAGTGSETCDASTVGAMRYNAGTGRMQICK